ncbi:MAG TPA: TraR/DksA family transcriptional regulator [Planctomycetota bacterium]|nr:TraR/DksA family transcriptional regulator [Planctomycetota bacterium]
MSKHKKKKDKLKRDKGISKKASKKPNALKALKASSKEKIKLNSPAKKVSNLKTKNKLKAGVVRSSKELRSAKDLRPSKTAVKKPALPPRPAIKLTKEMLEIRAVLQSMLTQMRRDIDHEVRGASARDLAHINDTSDMASDAAEGDLALRIAESETVEASEIERAIEKIDTGTYGTCEMCGQQIGADRLKFLPYVTLCIKCQALAEIRKREESEELDDLAEGTEADTENN